MKKRKIVAFVLCICLFVITPVTVLGAEKCTVYLHFNNVMTDNGFQDFDYTPQKLSVGSGWSFTKKKLDNFISCKSHFEYDGKEYNYNGEWQYTDGNSISFPISVKITADDAGTEKHIYVEPKYDVTIVKHLTVERIDPIRNTSASASNENKVKTYTHTFENPNDLGELEDYSFVSWQSDNSSVQPGESVTWDLDDFEDEYNTITYTAMYQPSVTVNWFNGDELLDSKKSFESIDSNLSCSVEGFDGWLTEDKNTPSDSYSPNGLNEEPTTINLYANIVEPEPVNGNTEPNTEPKQEQKNVEKPEQINNTDEKQDKEKSVNDITKPIDKKVQLPKEDTDDITKSETLKSVVVLPSNKKSRPVNNTDEMKERQLTAVVGGYSKPEARQETIDDNSIPLYNKDPDKKHWALVNLILAIITALALLKLSEKRYNIFAVILPVVAILVFVFTEYTDNPMVLIDKWTIVMVLIYLGMLLSRILGKDEEEEETQEDEYQ